MKPGDSDPTWSEQSGRSIERAREMYEAAYGGSGFEIAATDGPFAYRYTTASAGEKVTLRGNLFLGEVTGTTETTDYVVTWITSGQGTLDVGRNEVELALGRPMLFPTGRPQKFSFRNYRQNLMHFDAAFLEGIAAEMRGDDVELGDPTGAPNAPRRLRFDHATIPSDADLASWNIVVSQTAKVLVDQTPNDLLRSQVNREAAITLLRTFAHSPYARLPDSVLSPRSTSIREAVDYMHSYAHLPLTTLSIAHEVGISVRGLQHSFSRHLDLSPMEYLRGIRLDRVHAELRVAEPGQTRVYDVASRWGFGHLGRFAQFYATRFGEHPSDTLTARSIPL